MSTTAIFRSLHDRPRQPLVLANVWDAGSARLVESLGAEALATTSAGVAWSLGYPDGNRLPVEELEHVVHRIVSNAKVPVTIDVEGGYFDNPSILPDRLKRVLESGVAGINIEDGADPPEVLARKIEAIKRTRSPAGADVFVNVRTDVFLRNLSPDDQKVAETLRRAQIYRRAGADGLFVPGVVQSAQIGAIASATDLPVNVMAVPGLPALQELVDLGVRRLSAGSAISQRMYQHTARLTQKFLSDGDSTPLTSDSMAYGQLQTLFSDPRA